MPIVDASHTYKPLMSTRRGFYSVGPLHARFTYFEDCSDISRWVDNDSGGTSSQGTPPPTSFYFISGEIGSYAERYKLLNGFGDRVVVETRLYHSALGTLGNIDNFQLIVEHDDVRLYIIFASDGLWIYDGDDYNEVGTNLVTIGSWQIWSFDADFSTAATATVDIYLANVLKASAADCSEAGSYTDGKVIFRQMGTTTANRISFVDYLKIGK